MDRLFCGDNSDVSEILSQDVIALLKGDVCSHLVSTLEQDCLTPKWMKLAVNIWTRVAQENVLSIIVSIEYLRSALCLEEVLKCIGTNFTVLMGQFIDSSRTPCSSRKILMIHRNNPEITGENQAEFTWTDQNRSHNHVSSYHCLEKENSVLASSKSTNVLAL